MGEKSSLGTRVAYCGMMVALAMIFSYVEILIPVSFGIPGIKLGLANLVVLSGLYFLKPREVFLISVVRVMLVSFLFGNMLMLLYSLCGAVLSFLVMLSLKKMGGFSMIGISMAGGVSHNVGQILVAMWVLQNVGIISYLPVLLVSGLVTGGVMGALGGRVVPYFERKI